LLQPVLRLGGAKTNRGKPNFLANFTHTIVLPEPVDDTSQATPRLSSKS
jgi:hypothetical protein